MIEQLQALLHALGIDDPNVLAAVSRAVIAVIGAWTAVEGLCKVIGRLWRGVAAPAAHGVGRSCVSAVAWLRRPSRVTLEARERAADRAARDEAVLDTLARIAERLDVRDELGIVVQDGPPCGPTCCGDDPSEAMQPHRQDADAKPQEGRRYDTMEELKAAEQSRLANLAQRQREEDRLHALGRKRS